MSYSGDESSSDGSVSGNEKRLFTKKSKVAANELLDGSGEPRPRSAVRNAESSESLKDERGWIQWTKEEDEILMKAVGEGKHWTELSKLLPNKTARHCRKRYNVTLNEKVKRGNWTAEEDQQVVELVMKYGEKWAKIASEMQGRTADQIRGRYLVSLNPTNNTAPWTSEEYKILLNTHYKLGNQWVAIAKHLPGRQNKFISNHFKESVARKVEIFVNAKGKQNYGQLTEEEVDELISYLHVKVAGAMKPLLKGNANFKKTATTLERTQMAGSKRRRSSALLAASLTEGSAALYDPSTNTGSLMDPHHHQQQQQQLQQLQQQGGQHSLVAGGGEQLLQSQYERLMDGPVTSMRVSGKKAEGDLSSDDDSVDDLLASFEDPRGAAAAAAMGGGGNNRLDKPKYVKTTWTPAEDELLKQMFAKFREKPQKWKVISSEFNKVTQEGSFKDETQCERRWRNMPFTAQDDAMIMELAHTVGVDGVTWKEVAKNILGHSGTQCQERWIKLSSNAQALNHHNNHNNNSGNSSSGSLSKATAEAATTVEDITAGSGGDMQEAAVEVIMTDAMAAGGVGKFKKAKLTATKAAAASLPEAEIKDASKVKK